MMYAEMDDDVGLSSELLDCISQVLKKPKRRNGPLEKLLSQQEQQEQQQERQRDALASMRARDVGASPIASGSGGGGGGNGTPQYENQYTRNRDMLRSVRDIAGDMEDERARSFFNASGNLEKLLGPEMDEGSIPDTHVRAFAEPLTAALRKRERAGLSDLINAPLNLPAPSSTKKRQRANSKHVVEEDDDDATEAAVYASIAGGWLIESMQFRDQKGRDAIAKGLLSILTASDNRHLSSEAARAFCAIVVDTASSPAACVGKTKSWLPSHVDVVDSLVSLGYTDNDATIAAGRSHLPTESASAPPPPPPPAPFNVKNILRVVRCIAALPAASRPSKDIEALVYVVLRLSQDKSMIPMQADMRASLAALLACIGSDDWVSMRDGIAARIAHVRPTALAAIESIYTLKSALLSDHKHGREQWTDMRLRFARAFLCERLGMPCGEDGDNGSFASVNVVVDIVSALRAMNIPKIAAAAKSTGGDDDCGASGHEAQMRITEGGWEILAALRAVDIVLEDAHPEDMDEMSLPAWIDLLQHIGKSIKSSRTSLELLIKAATTELSSRYGFIVTFHTGNFPSVSDIEGTPQKRHRSLTPIASPLTAGGLFDASLDDNGDDDAV